MYIQYTDFLSIKCYSHLILQKKDYVQHFANEEIKVIIVRQLGPDLQYFELS